MSKLNVEDRHSATQHLFQFFDYDHLGGLKRVISSGFEAMAESLILTLPDGPELTVALRHLLEAKDAAVRAAHLSEKGQA